MIGTKRRSVSLRSDAEEAPLQSNKVLAESPFQSSAVEPSAKVGSTLPVDFKRALSSRQHVRALNTQFASWVQSQLQNHPDELWEDGVQDYVAHASKILERFSDVVNWLRANSSTAVSMPSVEAQPAEKIATPEAKGEEEKTPSPIPIGEPKKFVPSFGRGSSTQASSPSTASLFSSPWTSSVFSSQSSLSGANVSLGSQASSQSTSLFASGVSTKSPSQSPLSSGNASPWASSLFNSQSSLSGAKASSGLSSSSQASSQSTSPFASGLSTKSQSQSPLSGGMASPWASSVFNSQSSGANVTSGLSPSSQASSQSTSLFASGVSSKSPSQSPLSTGNFSFGLSSNSQTTLQSTAVTPPWTSTAFSNSSTAPSGLTSGSTNSWSFGSSSNTQTPFAFGNQNMAPLNTATAEDDNEEEQQPSSPSLKKSEEKGIHVVHEVKCKLYMKSTDAADKDPWKDKGTGQLSIKCKEGESKGTKESKPTIIIRNDVGRISLNASLYSGIKLNMPKNNSIVAIFHTSGDNGSGEVAARTFLIRTRNQEDRDKLAEAIKEHAPSA